MFPPTMFSRGWVLADDGACGRLAPLHRGLLLCVLLSPRAAKRARCSQYMVEYVQSVHERSSIYSFIYAINVNFLHLIYIYMYLFSVYIYIYTYRENYVYIYIYVYYMYVYIYIYIYTYRRYSIFAGAFFSCRALARETCFVSLIIISSIC